MFNLVDSHIKFIPKRVYSHNVLSTRILFKQSAHETVNHRGKWYSIYMLEQPKKSNNNIIISYKLIGIYLNHGHISLGINWIKKKNRLIKAPVYYWPSYGLLESRLLRRYKDNDSIEK